MEDTKSNSWFKGSIAIACTMEDVKNSLNDIGKHYKELISVYPGITKAELKDSGEDFVIIKTNEGTMKRTNITVESSENHIVVQLHEEYITSKLTTNAHVVENFEYKNDQIELEIEMTDHSAPGFLGFFLRSFGSKSIGNGFLDSYKKILEV